MSSTFALPLPAYQEVKVQAGGNTRKRKRQQQAKSPDNRGRGESVQDLSDESRALQSQYTAVVTPEERSQRLLAGQNLDQEPPKFPFPHLKPASNVPRHSDRVGQSITSQPASSQNDGDSSGHLKLRQQHLSAITAVLHRCLLEEDWTRASRALGLILRDQVGGRQMDIRNVDRWGIGAEILLRQGTASTERRPSSERLRQSSEEAGRPTSSMRSKWYTPGGFERAKAYYKNLIVQFPFHKANPFAVNALDFYPAMYGLWVYVVQEESKMQTTDSSVSQSEENMSDFSLPATAVPLAVDIKIRELEGAHQIATEMDATMTTFPFRDDAELKRLRGMVALWVADLIDCCSAHLDTLGQEDDHDALSLEQLSARISRMALTSTPEDTSRNALHDASKRGRQLAQDMFNQVSGDVSRTE